eukprot:1161918-Pelagomonas_calceolata.AAC.3
MSPNQTDCLKAFVILINSVVKNVEFGTQTVIVVIAAHAVLEGKKKRGETLTLLCCGRHRLLCWKGPQWASGC